MRYLLKGVVVTAVLMACSAGLGFGAPASASTRQTRSISVWVTPSNAPQQPSRVVVTGSFVDFGASTRVNALGRRDRHGSFTLLVLQEGSILVSGPDLSPSATTGGAKGRSGTCSVSTSSESRAQILRGTKAYAGIQGTILVSVSSVLILPLHSSGACVTGSRTVPIASWSTITGTGTVTIPVPHH